jgi:leucyl-tRNA synthetase
MLGNGVMQTGFGLVAGRRALGGILETESVALSLFAPHLAEEAWRLLGNPPYVVQQRWPFLPGPADA